ncbi:MAG TPA: hypothetical protein VND87_07195 [Stellaceae bacterium]|nr:hypothetical protein [Stellaceae bacterium]
MDKKIAALLGAVAGLATAGTAQAATAPAVNGSEAPPASSYADLLAPIPNAIAALQADDAARAPQNPTEMAQYYNYPYSYTYSYPQYYNRPYHRHYYRHSHHHHHHHHHHQ